MSNATWAIPSFLGGEISAFAQGRFDKPDYKISLSTCLNSFPVEIGAWTRRPGTAHAGATRGGVPARVIKFDFEQAVPYTLEFSNVFVRFRSGLDLITTNDQQVVVAISGANPAVLQTTTATNWSSGNTLVFSNLGATGTVLQNRRFVATLVDSSHFSLRDELTQVTLDGSTIGGLAGGATVSRVLELTTPYAGSEWEDIRSIQAETTAVLLTGSVAPYMLSVPTLPINGVDAVFALNPAVLVDGPYLDPFVNGVQLTSASVSGNVTLTLSFPTYGATTAYTLGSFVTSGGINYVSLIDANVGNTPVSSPSAWAATDAGAAIGPNGFVGTDIGRAVRLLSEPAAWAVGSTYSANAIVSYNPSGQPGAATYWTSLVGSNIGNIPGNDITHWQLAPGNAAIWTWGRITGFPNIINPVLAGSANIGNMTLNGGLVAAFDSVFSKAAVSSATQSNIGGALPAGTPVSVDAYVGKNYSGASDQKVAYAVVYPSNDQGLGALTFQANILYSTGVTIIATLRAKSSVPLSISDGIALGSVTTSNTTVPLTIVSNDQVTAWKYVWVEVVVSGSITYGGGCSSFNCSAYVGQLSIYNPAGSGATALGIIVEILGAPLLYSGTPITTWRLGVYSNTTGWPKCGTYHEGRIWLGGAVANRFDASVSNGIIGNSINFAPTGPSGTVATNNAISYTLNSDGVNPIFAMKPDLQGVVCFTQQGEWLVQAPTTGPIAANNIVARRMTKNGSSNIEPARTENANLFVKRYSRKLLEYFADAYSGKYSAPNLADKAGHRVSAGIAELAYVEAVTPIVWMRDALGALIGMTYRRTTISTQQPPDFYAWHQHTLGTGRVVESICSGPSVDGSLDALTMVTNDPVTGIRHVEILTDTPDEDTALADAWFLDDAVVPSSTSSSLTPVTGAPYGGLTLYGLGHLEGKTVQVFAGGLDCGDRGDNKTTFTDFVVTNGSVFVPYGDSISAGSGKGLFTAAFAAAAPNIVVGLTYNSDGQLVRPIAAAETGSRSGPALGLIRRNHRFAALLNSTRGLSVGASLTGTTLAEKMYPVRLVNNRGDAIPPLSAFSGIVEEPVNDTFSYEGGLCWRVSRPFPANIVAMSGNIRTQDQ